MNRIVPFDTKEYCDICQDLGAYNFMGDYLCEKCYRDDIEREPYQDELDELDDEFYCPCTECKCGKDLED